MACDTAANALYQKTENCTQRADVYQELFAPGTQDGYKALFNPKGMLDYSSLLALKVIQLSLSICP